MAEQKIRLNKPVSDEMLYAAGMPRDLPEKEPPPAPPATLPEDMNLTSPGIEYRAMSGVLAIPSEQRRLHNDTSNGADKRFAWLTRPRQS